MAVRLACSHTIPSDWRYGCLYSGGALAATFRWKRLVNGYIIDLVSQCVVFLFAVILFFVVVLLI